jgi:hypothetical protein
MSRKMSRFVVCVLALLLAATTVSYARRGAVAATQNDLATKSLENVKIEAQSIGALLEKLSLHYDIPVGFEAASNDDERVNYQLDFKKGSLSDLLNEFVARHDQYAWEIRDGVVNIFPKDNYRDALFRDLLATQIDSFAVKKKTSCMELAKSLAATSEVRKVLAAHGTSYRERDFSGSYIPQVGQNFALDVSNMTLKSMLNKVIKESPAARFWLVTRNSDQTFFLSVGARFEDSPI